MKKILLLLAAPFVFFSVLTAQITREEADEIVLNRMSQETQSYIVYAKEDIQAEMTIITANEEELELSYPCWVYYISYTESGRYLIVNESNGNVLEVNARNDDRLEELAEWRIVPIKIPLGRWTVVQVAVEKNTGGNIETNVYNSAAELQGFFIPCIQEMEINEQTITVRYPNGREETVEYVVLDGNLLIVLILVGAQIYRYSVSGENLILIADYHYVNNNLQEKTTTRITENRIINLKKITTEP